MTNKTLTTRIRPLTFPASHLVNSISKVAAPQRIKRWSVTVSDLALLVRCDSSYGLPLFSCAGARAMSERANSLERLFEDLLRVSLTSAKCSMEDSLELLESGSESDIRAAIRTLRFAVKSSGSTLSLAEREPAMT